MRCDRDLGELAQLLRVGAKTARTIAAARGRDRAAVIDEADAMALDLDAIVGATDPRADRQAAAFRLRRDR